MSGEVPVPELDLEALRDAVRGEYCEVAKSPGKGFHFHTGRTLAALCEYPDDWLDGIPEAVIERFAGTGNPFLEAPLRGGERVVDLGCGAGIDSILAPRQVGPEGAVVGVKMTPEMLVEADRARDAAGVGRGEAEDRPLDRVNRRRSPGRRARVRDRGGRLRGVRDHLEGAGVRRRAAKFERGEVRHRGDQLQGEEAGWGSVICPFETP